MSNHNDLERKGELESFLTKSHHYFSISYKPCFSGKPFNKYSNLFKAIGLGKYKIGDVLHPLEAGYAKFWEKRNRGRDHWNKKVRKYISRFFDIFEQKDSE